MAVLRLYDRRRPYPHAQRPQRPFVARQRPIAVDPAHRMPYGNDIRRAAHFKRISRF